MPQIAADFDTTVGEAAIVIAAYTVAHGSVQLIIGPIADRFGKYRTVAIVCVLATLLVALCGTVTTLPELALARLASGAAAGWIIPISMAYVGDVTPADRLQPILAATSRADYGAIVRPGRGRRAGRPVRLAQRLLHARRHVRAGRSGPHLRARGQSQDPRARPARSRPPRFVADYVAVLSNPWARFVIIMGFIEATLAWGAFAYVGANLRVRFGLSLTAIGLTVGCFGIGGLIYAGSCVNW